jgi:hypothetical protein
MIESLLMLGGITGTVIGYGSYYIKKHKEIRLTTQWNETVERLYTKQKDDKQLFPVAKVIKKEYGYDMIVGVGGKGFKVLQEKKDVFESVYGCDIQMKQSENKKCAYVRLFMDLTDRDDVKLQLKWEDVMLNAGITNLAGETFTLKNVEIKENYGYDCEIIKPNGLGYEHLKKNSELLNDNFGLVHWEYKPFSNSFPAKIVIKPLPDTFAYEPVKPERPSQLYVGTTYYYEPICIDLKSDPGWMISGTTNSGKSIMLKIALANLAYHFEPQDMDFWFLQVSKKVGDFDEFLKLKHTKGYAYSYDYAVKMLNYLADQIEERSEILKKAGCKNIWKYNAKSENKMPISYVIFEEFASFMPGTEASDTYYHQKKKCLELLETIAGQGRSCGLYVIVCILRPDKEHMPPFVKSLLNARTAMKQLNTASSLVVIDMEGAERLSPREEIVQVSGQYYRVKTPFIDEDTFVYKLLKKKMEYNHKYFNIDDYFKEKKERENQEKQEKKKGNVTPIPQKEVAITKQQNNVKNNGNISYIPKGKGKAGVK